MAQAKVFYFIFGTAATVHDAIEQMPISEIRPVKQLSNLTLPLKNVSLAKCFNSDKENGNDKNIKGALHARIQTRGSPFGGERPKHRGGGQNAGVVDQTLFNWVNALRHVKLTGA